MVLLLLWALKGILQGSPSYPMANYLLEETKKNENKILAYRMANPWCKMRQAQKKRTLNAICQSRVHKMASSEWKRGHFSTLKRDGHIPTLGSSTEIALRSGTSARERPVTYSENARDKEVTRYAQQDWITQNVNVTFTAVENQLNAYFHRLMTGKIKYLTG